ncbi:hypothetical protein AOLI_G00070640 [Acnodon oligacanthus]
MTGNGAVKVGASLGQTGAQRVPLAPLENNESEKQRRKWPQQLGGQQSSRNRNRKQMHADKETEQGARSSYENCIAELRLLLAQGKKPAHMQRPPSYDVINHTVGTSGRNRLSDPEHPETNE